MTVSNKLTPSRSMRLFVSVCDAAAAGHAASHDRSHRRTEHTNDREPTIN